VTTPPFTDAVARLRAWHDGEPAYDDGATSLRGDLAVVLRAVVPMTRQPLTARQAELLAFIRETVRVRGCAPSFEEIAQHFGYRSLATVSEHLTNLARKGVIRRDYNAARGIVLTDGVT